MAGNELSIDPKKILTVIHQQLGELFFAASKTDAKQAFNRLMRGNMLPLLQISSPEQGDVTGVLALDSSDFAGKLNFSGFRDALASHLNRIEEKLNNDEQLNIFSSEETGSMLFHIPGLVKTDNQHNVLVTGLAQSKAGELEVRLMFLDPANYDSIEKKH